MEEETTLNTVETNEAETDNLFDEDEDLFDLEDDEAEEAEAPEQDTQEEKWTVKYNGQEQQLTREQMTEYAQKGMNYDHVKGELDSVREGNVFKAMKAYADKAGMSVEDAARFLLESDAADAEMAAEKEIRDQYGQLPDAVIKELVASRTAEKKKAATVKQESKEEKAWADALEAYPDINKDNIPQDVLDAVSRGKDPLMALRENEIKQLKKQLADQAVAEKNKENKAKSVGSVRSNGGAEKDAFLAGLGF